MRLFLHQAPYLTKYSVADLTIPFTNRLSEFIFLLVKLNTNSRKNSPKDGMFKFTNFAETLLYLGKLSNLLDMGARGNFRTGSEPQKGPLRDEKAPPPKDLC